MKKENSDFDKKSLRAVTGKTADWEQLAKDSVAFANAKGGTLCIGIEKDVDEPPPFQQITSDLPELIQRRIKEHTVNVEIVTEICTSRNGGQYIKVRIPHSGPVASTSDGRYSLRIADASCPIVGDDILRLANERATLPWETQVSLQVTWENADYDSLAGIINSLRNSDRVKTSVKEKSDKELLNHYLLIHNGILTNLGILFFGKQTDRSRLGTAPVIQVLKYDERGNKVNKWVWDDYSLSPILLIESVWKEIPDFRERYELPSGLYRQHVPVFDEALIRELLINALVHRPYTQRGDIFINLHPNRLEIVNPGRLPLGVTPSNILHTSVRRNEHFARLFHDLKLMEREGSGFDLVYEIMLSQGRPAPVLREGLDRVEVIIERRILKPLVIDLIAKADAAYQLSQRERICLGLLAQQDSITAKELTSLLELSDIEALRPWLGRLKDLGLVQSSGRTRAMRYFVSPLILKKMELPTATTLKRIEPHRLQALIIEDLSRYPGSAISEIHKRIGVEITRSQIKRTLERLEKKQRIRTKGIKRWRRYWEIG